jgi:epsilon-lactone hydrolase
MDTLERQLIDDQRRFFTDVIGAQPLPDDARLTETALGGIPALEILVADRPPRGTMLWLHGGGYVAGSPRTAVGPALALARAADLRVLSVDWRLAPEHPFPAGRDDAVAAFRGLVEETPGQPVLVGGESAGAGLAVAMLVAARDAGLPMPAAAVLWSPAVDLRMTSRSWETKAAVDPVIRAEPLRVGFRAYAGGRPLDDPGVSPLLADLRGLPPLLVQVGSYEVLQDDSLELARRAALGDVEVTLESAPGMTHVFPWLPDKPQSRAALERAARFVEAHTPLDER